MVLDLPIVGEDAHRDQVSLCPRSQRCSLPHLRQLLHNALRYVLPSPLLITRSGTLRHLYDLLNVTVVPRHLRPIFRYLHGKGFLIAVQVTLVLSGPPHVAPHPSLLNRLLYHPQGLVLPCNVFFLIHLGGSPGANAPVLGRPLRVGVRVRCWNVPRAVLEDQIGYELLVLAGRHDAISG